MSHWCKTDAKNDSSFPLATVLLRRRRREANAAMRRFRSVPSERHVHFVQLTATTLPPRIKAVKALSQTDRSCWMLSLRAARSVIQRDRAAGGGGYLDTFEYRRCLVCNRVLLGRDAADYRERCRWPREKCYWPWGPTCDATCRPGEKRAAQAIAMGETRPQRKPKEYGCEQV